MARISRNLSFDAGIEQILTQADPFPPSLPETGQAIPGIDRYEQQLQEVLFPPSVEQELLESFRPDIANREILTPVGYQSALEESHREVEQWLAKQSQGGGETQAGSLGHADVLRLAAQLMERERELRDLLSTYRHLLHRA